MPARMCCSQIRNAYHCRRFVLIRMIKLHVLLVLEYSVLSLLNFLGIESEMLKL